MSKIDLISDVMEQMDRIKEDLQKFQKHIIEEESNFSQEDYIIYLIAVGYFFSKSEEEYKLNDLDGLSTQEEKNLENILRQFLFSVSTDEAKRKIKHMKKYKEVKAKFLENLAEKARKGKL